MKIKNCHHLAQFATIKILVLVVFLFGQNRNQLAAQVAPVYTNYFYNPLSYNPAYAGSREAISFLFLHRSQWTGFKGAPQSNSAVLHSPIPNQNLGAGLSIIQDKAGPLSRSGAYMDWAYQLKFESKAKLSFGLKLGVNSFSANFNNLYANDQEDILIGDLFDNHLHYSLGSGVYYEHKKYFLGLSAPKLINDNLSKEEGNSQQICDESNTVFLSAGYMYKFHPGLFLQPTTLIRLANGAPPSVDISASLIFFEKISAGAFGRIGDSFGLMFHYWFNGQLRLGYSYDYSTSALTQYNNGSHEFVISYDLNYKNEKIKSPRYF